MIKLIQPKKYRNRNAGQRFAEKIAEKSAAFYYDDESAQLTLLNYSAQSGTDSMGEILELLTMVLGLLKNGLGISGGRSEVYLLNQVRVLLSCEENTLKGNTLYSELCEMYNSLAETVNLRKFGGDNVSALEQRLEKCTILLSQERARNEKLSEKVTRNRKVRERLLRPANIMQNSMNLHTLEMLRQNRQLLSILGNAPDYLKLLSKQIDYSSKRLKTRYYVQDFYAALSEEQKVSLLGLIREKNLFSKERAFLMEHGEQQWAIESVEHYRDSTTDQVIELIVRQLREQTTEQELDSLSERIIGRLTDQITDQIVVLLEHNGHSSTEKFVRRLTGYNRYRLDRHDMEALAEFCIKQIASQSARTILEKGGGAETEELITAIREQSVRRIRSLLSGQDTEWGKGSAAESAGRDCKETKEEILGLNREIVEEELLGLRRIMLPGEIQRQGEMGLLRVLGEMPKALLDQVLGLIAGQIQEELSGHIFGQKDDLLSEKALGQLADRVTVLTADRIRAIMEENGHRSMEYLIRKYIEQVGWQFQSQNMRAIVELGVRYLIEQGIRAIVEESNQKTVSSLSEWIREQDSDYLTRTIKFQDIRQNSEKRLQLRKEQHSISETERWTETTEELRFLLEHASEESMREFIGVLKREAELEKARMTSSHTQSMQEILEEEAYQYYEAKRARFEEYRRDKEELQRSFEEALSSLVQSRRITQIQEMLEEFDRKEKTVGGRTEEESHALRLIREEIQKYLQEEHGSEQLKTRIMSMNRDTLFAYSDFLISYVNENVTDNEVTTDWNNTMSSPGKTSKLLQIAEKLEQAFYEPDFVVQGYEMLKVIWEKFLKENDTEELWRISAGFFQTGRQISLQRFMDWISRAQLEVQGAFTNLFVTEYDEMAQVHHEIERMQREYESEMLQGQEQYEHTQAEEAIRRIRFQSKQLLLLDEVSRSVIKRILTAAFTENRDILTDLHTDSREEVLWEEFIDKQTDIVYQQFQPQSHIKEQGLFYDTLQDVKALTEKLYGFTEQYLRQFVKNDATLTISVTADALYADIQRDFVEYLSENVSDAVFALLHGERRHEQSENRKNEITERREISAANREQIYEKLIFESTYQMLTELTEKNQYFWLTEYTKKVANDLTEFLQVSQSDTGGLTEIIEEREDIWRKNILLRFSKREISGFEGNYEYLEGAVSEIVAQIRNELRSEELSFTETSEHDHISRMVGELLVDSEIVMEAMTCLVNNLWESREMELVRHDILRGLSQRIVTEHQGMMGNLYVDIRNMIWQDVELLTKSEHFENDRREFWEYLNQTANYHKTQLLTVKNYLHHMMTETDNTEFGISSVLIEKITEEIDREIRTQSGRAWEDLETRLVHSEHTSDSYEYRIKNTEITEEDFVGQFVYATLEQMIQSASEESGERLLVETTTDHILRTSYRRHMEPLVRLRVEKLDETVRKFMLQLTAERFLEWQEHTEEGDSYVQLLERVFDQYGEKKAFRKVKEETVSLINSKPAKVSAHLLKNRLKEMLAHSEEFLKLYGFMEEYSRVKMSAAGRKGAINLERSQMTELVSRVSDQIFEKFYLQIERGHIMAKVKEYLDRSIVYDGDGAVRNIWNIAEIRKNAKSDGFLRALEEYAHEELKVFTERLTYDEIYSERSELVKVGDLSYRITQHLMKGHSGEISDFVKTQYVSELLRHLSEQQFVQSDKIRSEIIQKLDEYLRKDRRTQTELRQSKTIKTTDIVERYLEHVFGEQWKTGGKRSDMAGLSIWSEAFAKHALEEFTSDAAQVIYLQVLSRNEIEEYARNIEEIDVDRRIRKMTEAMLRDGQMLKQVTGQTYLETLPGTFTELANYYKGKYGSKTLAKQENLLKLLIEKQEKDFSHADMQNISNRDKEYKTSQEQLHETELANHIIYRILLSKVEERDTAWQQEMLKTLLSRSEWKDELRTNSLQLDEENILWSLDVKLIPKLIAAQEEFPMQEQAATVHLFGRGLLMQDIIQRQIQSSTDRIQRSIQMVHERKLISHAPEQVNEESYVSLEYMEDYFDHSKNANEIQFALPAAKQETQVPLQLEEKMSEIYRQIDHLSQQVEQVRNETQNVSQSFVSKSEMEYMRKKLVSDMEEDILVAKRRHGGF